MQTEETLRPAFGSVIPAGALVLLLALFLAGPWLAVHKLWPAQKRTYTPASIRWDKFPWLHQPLFEDTNDIDLAFVGSSRMFYAIDAPYVQQKLDERLGRNTVVRSVCCFGNGFDRLYLLTRELLAHRHVKTLVFCDECAVIDPIGFRDPAAFYLSDDGVVLPSTPPANTAAAYYAAMLRLPADLRAAAFGELPDAPGRREPRPTIPYAPHTSASSGDARWFTATTASTFSFSSQPPPPAQIYYAKQFARLAREHGCQLVALHLPLRAAPNSPVITESRDWTHLLPAKTSLLGIPEARLLGGLSERELASLYSDPWHLGENGRHYFTPLITPALVQFHASHFPN